jgi:2-desacetyl-2-hydroxyethyl bacteriochlorophyllide A dehydrogenase
MKAARLFGKNDLRIVDMDTPVPSCGEAVVRVKRCGICGTDYAIFKGAFQDSIQYPITMGHEWSGVVEQVGPGVTNVSPGDWVAGDACVSCGACQACLTGNYMHCAQRRNVGTTHTWDGAYAEYVRFPARHLFQLPDEVEFDSGALMEPAATAMLSVKQARVGFGDNVVVHGTGPIGLAAAAIAKLAGAAKVVVTGRKDFKLTLAESLGADVTVNTEREEMQQAVMRALNGEGADAIIEASGSETLLRDSLHIAANGARIAIVSFFEQDVHLNVDMAVFKDISILPVCGNIGMSAPTLRLMAVGRLDLTPMITQRCALEDVPRVLSGFKTDNGKKVKIMIEY